MNGKQKLEARDERIQKELQRLLYAAGFLLALAGVVLLYAATWRGRLPPQPGPLFAISNRALLIIGGALHLGAAVWILFSEDFFTAGALMLWAGTNHLVYVLGMWWVHSDSPLPLLRIMGKRYGVAPETVGVCWKVLMALLIIEGLTQLIAFVRRKHRLEDEEFLRRWRAVREQASKQDARSVARNTQGNRK